MEIDLVKLKELAEKATHEPWKSQSYFGQMILNYNIMDWTKTALYECYLALQVSDDATSVRSSVPERINLLGRTKTFNLGTREQGKKHGNEVELEVTRLETWMDGQEKLLIDKLNFIHRVNGTDLLGAVRSQMGLNV